MAEKKHPLLWTPQDTWLILNPKDWFRNGIPKGWNGYHREKPRVVLYSQDWCQAALEVPGLILKWCPEKRNHRQVRQWCKHVGFHEGSRPVKKTHGRGGCVSSIFWVSLVRKSQDDKFYGLRSPYFLGGTNLKPSTPTCFSGPLRKKHPPPKTQPFLRTT